MKLRNLTVALAVVLAAELWYAYRPDLNAEIVEWLGSARGRFEVWAAERDRNADRD